MITGFLYLLCCLQACRDPKEQGLKPEAAQPCTDTELTISVSHLWSYHVTGSMHYRHSSSYKTSWGALHSAALCTLQRLKLKSSYVREHGLTHNHVASLGSCMHHLIEAWKSVAVHKRWYQSMLMHFRYNHLSLLFWLLGQWRHVVGINHQHW